jgi:conjugative transfer signal peptidase TraF
MAQSKAHRAMTRRSCLLLAGAATIGLAAASVIEMPPRLIWNATESAPLGLYLILAVDASDLAELVAVRPPETLARFMAERGYIGQGAPLLKRIAGLPGQEVCRIGHAITVDGVEMGHARERDSAGRDLPVWQDCRVLSDGELFLLNWDVEDSLDGRYFGPLPASSVIGRAFPLWTDPDGDGRYAWRAPTH